MKTTNSNMSAIAVNKSLLKEYQTSYGRTVYLDKDSEFQIKLFNPTTETIGAEIFINDKSLGEKLIIRPGQIIWLERYFNEARKFRFDVYEVDAKVEAVKEAIRNNGDIMVKFYKEERTPYYKRYLYGDVAINNHTYNINSTGMPASDPYRITCSDCNLSYDLSAVENNALYSSTPGTYATSIDCADGTNISGELLGLGASSVTASHNAKTNVRGFASNNSINSMKLRSATLDSAKMETGRVEKGGYSDQRFSEVDIDLEYFSFATEKIKLLPKSQKPVFKEDLEKLYCPECGRKVKTKFKFCPFCGAKL